MRFCSGPRVFMLDERVWFCALLSLGPGDDEWSIGALVEVLPIFGVDMFSSGVVPSSRRDEAESTVF
ncbi:hypothetical protein DF021_10415 [Burkholderia stagnalis]|uniref:Uncharacterized protein n=1 Tax=Burkholderia stagnalis TaxID=1503054 RepID=A0ABX9YRD7_9BURK|nr:hypothetical protein DF163_04975 [Burkholderia stagnalis]RQQ54576.1 hypothetical protein DF162_02305 [Burkholderia stagnalis]RQQ60971.1 hypothetical protein DF158_11135 [Burkholderia stagnalis]RQQ70827.1 hypothetical protein DF137_10260 [Burkholderia stagnalis]RQQ71973.1 hypothetical protein DF139_09365 [Burkholderia stagnalis]